MTGFSLRRPLGPQRRYEVREEIMEMSRPGFPFYAMVALSSIIAAFGLLANSPAVVIGAMLVAPLMGPIFGITLGLLTGEYPILWKAVVSEVIGVILSIGFGVVAGMLPWKLQFGAEIMMRTQPTLYDLIIAVAAGLAGAYAVVKEQVSPTLPGVAIAVAVLPPLAACGLCIAEGRWDCATGAFLLFLANFLAIEIAAAFVFTIFGMTEVESREIVDFWGFFAKFSVSLAALALIGTFMTKTLVNLVEEQQFSRAVRQTLKQELASGTGTYLSEVRFRDNEGGRDVIATVMTPSAFQPEEVKRLEDALQKDVRGDIHLIVRAVLSQDTDRSGPVFLPEEELQERAKAEARQRFAARISDLIGDHLADIAGASLRNVKTEELTDHIRITAEVGTPAPITPSRVAAMQDTLQSATDRQVKLFVRSAITRHASSKTYLYDKEAAGPSAEEVQLERELKRVIEREIAATADGATLTDLNWSKADGRVSVLAIACTPEINEAGRVAQIQEILREQVDDTVELTIRSELGAEVAAAGPPDTAISTDTAGEEPNPNTNSR